MIKLIAVDLDGTLLLDDHITIPPANRKALKEAREKGIAVVIATGRCYSLAQDIIAQAGCVNYAITSNGAAIVELNEKAAGKNVYRDEIPAHTSGEIERLLHAYLPDAVTYQCYIDGAAYMWKGITSAYRRIMGINTFADNLLSKMTLLDDLAAFCAGKNVEKFNVDFIGHKKEFLSCLECMGEFSITSSYGDNVEINAQDTSKGKALAALCDRLHIAPHEVMAFGDSSNDDGMLEFAGLSYSMENAPEQTKRAAKYTAPPNTEYGVAQVISREILQRKS
jgi:Cof subfamily protein (haloacid dehalogenase superfamily)